MQLKTEKEDISLPRELSARSKEKKERQENGSTANGVLFCTRFCTPHGQHYPQNPNNKACVVGIVSLFLRGRNS